MRRRRPGQRHDHRAPLLSTDDDNIRSRNLAAVHRGFEGIADGDADRMLAHYADDLVLELPYADPPVRLDGKEIVRDYLRQAFEVYRFTLTITHVHELVDPDQLVLEYTSSGSNLSTGDPYANTYIGVYRFRDSLIAAVREYYNPGTR